MRAVGLKVLKNKLSEYVRLAASGELILVTDREKVVAELGPPETARSPAVADAVVAELVRNGIVTPTRARLAGPPPRKPIAKLDTILDWLEDTRSDRL